MGVEANERLYVNLNNASEATLADAQGIGTIIDDDASLPIVSVNNVSAVEGNAGIPSSFFTVSLSATSAQTVTVPFTTANGTALAGSDYKTTTGTLSFSPGVKALTISVLVSGDRTVEPDETFKLNLGAPGNAIMSSIQNQGSGTIVNDDGATSALAAGESLSTANSIGDSLYDVNQDGVVSPIDALILINELNAPGPSSAAITAVSTTPAAEHDISGDGVVSAMDVLMVINLLNSRRSPNIANQSMTSNDSNNAVDLLMADLSLLQ
jgi:hypothetical protein